MICTLEKTGSKILRTSKKAKFQPFVDALLVYEAQITCIFVNLILIQGLGSENLLDNCKSPG